MKHFMKQKLSLCHAGRKLKICSIYCQNPKKDKLFAMGIIPGGSISIVNNQKNGPFLINSGKTRFVLDLKTANLIICQEE